MDLISIEIIVWIVLTLILIGVPTIRGIKQYAHFLTRYIREIQDIEVSLPQRTHTQEQQQDSTTTNETVMKESPQQEKVSTNVPEKTIEPPEKTEPISQHKAQEEIKEVSEYTKQKKQQKIETIKYAALANKERGNKEQYEKKLIEGLALDGEHTEFLSLLSTHYFESGQLIKALSLLKKIVNNNPTNHKAIRQIGQIYFQQEQRETAQLLFEKALSIKKDHPKYHISMVEVYYANKQIEKAIQMMEKVLKLRPTNTDYLMTIATLYEEAKKPTLAQTYYTKVLELDPGNAHAKKSLKNL